VKLIVLAGSPKGEKSVTMQYVRFIQKGFPQHDFVIHQVAQTIQRLERDESAFRGVIKEIEASDVVLWAFPLYYFLVCSQYKRFIELIWERNTADAFAGKYAAALSTSIHFYDHTAHEYIRAICDDLNMRFVEGYSAHMRELLDLKGRERIMLFARNVLHAAEKGMEFAKLYSPLVLQSFTYRPNNLHTARMTTGKRVAIVTDSREGNLGRMIGRFSSLFEKSPDIIDLSRIDMKGGCQGCLHCGPRNQCVYADKDEFIEMFNTRLRSADILLLAGGIRDRYLSARWKMFFDRSFFNTHQPVLKGKQVGFLISGPLSSMSNLREILTAYVEINGANPAGFVSDEMGDSQRIDRAIDGLAERLVRTAEQGYVRSPSFLGIGGMKVFRDDVWGELRVVFRADHKTYRKTGVYDFPQKRVLKNMFIRTAAAVTGIPFIQRKMVENMREFMIMPYRKVVDAQSSLSV
jgi:multimeric flavodoxin WrbA